MVAAADDQVRIKGGHELMERDDVYVGSMEIDLSGWVRAYEAYCEGFE